MSGALATAAVAARSVPTPVLWCLGWLGSETVALAEREVVEGHHRTMAVALASLGRQIDRNVFA